MFRSAMHISHIIKLLCYAFQDEGFDTSNLEGGQGMMPGMGGGGMPGMPPGMDMEALMKQMVRA